MYPETYLLVYAGLLTIHTEPSLSIEDEQAKYRATNGFSEKSNNLVGTLKCCAISSQAGILSSETFLIKRYDSEIKSLNISNSDAEYG